MTNSDRKEGIELILDLAEALRVRIESTRDQRLTPPADGASMRDATTFEAWAQLTKSIVTEATRLKLTAAYQPLRLVYAALDRIGALMALPADAPPSEVVSAVQIALKRLQELELRVANFSEAATPAPMQPVAPTPHERQHGILSRSEAIAQGMTPEPDEEPRPSYVLERMETLILGSWLGDATRDLERVAEYMAANESRMSEDLFDELRRIAEKLSRWADEVIRGNMFPRS